MNTISLLCSYMFVQYHCIAFHVKPVTCQYRLHFVSLHSMSNSVTNFRRRFAKGSKGRCQSNIYPCHSEKVSKCVSTVGATIHFVQNNWSYHRANVYQHFHLIEVPYRTKSTGLDDKEFLFPILWCSTFGNQ